MQAGFKFSPSFSNLGGQEGSYLRGAPFLSPKPPINPYTLKVRAYGSEFV
nr:MAG TPA: hypothetical protein [Caudoviricetes sp.]